MPVMRVVCDAALSFLLPPHPIPARESNVAMTAVGKLFSDDKSLWLVSYLNWPIMPLIRPLIDQECH